MKIILLFLLALSFPLKTFSNVIITGTRVIYPEAADSMVVQLTNNSTSPSLIQSWIDSGDINSTPENSNAPFYLYPPIVKVDGLQGQQLKIKKTDIKLPNNVESVFYLNILDIPKTPDSMIGKNTIQLATRSRIKIFYRPKALTERSEDITEKISYQINSNNVLVKNNSQYHFTIVTITTPEDKNLALVDSEMIPPLSSKELPLKGKLKNHNLILSYVDDYGVFRSKNIQP
ncbi:MULTISPECIES: molecular chaperone [Providencia]|uniref:Gram-negative pili assembly chaperone domain protein n=4 Tax=Providencia rustigianii TaxID=158850 RepID=D1P6X1_9GAMM|nr:MULTISPECIES: molecular chaperone [Providencia]EFB70818.1 gram-negative pili assembly chaperone domain protein [Providencia rustigianii DSM 4541]MTC56200.1 fimbria/pilus periplasmic chaperone [Providencia rustigianii]SPY76417.1 Chaperone protein fimC precursor [Providencia rustigianii]SUC34381.1 Chaperone protein fimC precursor [Providencia rustigianii]